MAQFYAIIDANGAFTGRTYSDADIPTKTSEMWPGKWAEPSAYHKPIPKPSDDLHTWDEKVNGWVLPDHILEEFKTATLQRVKSLGEKRVYSEYGPHAQRRLGVSKDDTAREKCHTLIEAVRSLVDATEITITDAANVTQIKKAETTFVDTLKKV